MSRPRPRLVPPLPPLPGSPPTPADPVAEAMREPDVIELDPICAQLVLGLAARQEKIQRETIDPFQRDVHTTHAFVEERVGLPPGSIGTTHHVVGGDPPRLRRLPQHPPAPAPPEAS